jgi:class 3 adenylate cyclase
MTEVLSVDDTVADDEKRWQRVGLYDPESPTADERLELLRYLERLGATIDEMVEANENGLLVQLSSELLRRGERISARRAADILGMPLETVERIGRAAGLARGDADAPLYRDKDIEALQVFTSGVALFGEDVTLQFTRVCSAAMASIADAAMASFGVGIAPRLEATHATELERAQATEVACAVLIGQVPTGLETLFFHQVEAAIRRAVASGIGDGGPSAHVAVGFLDLVGSTSLAQQLDPTQLGEVISSFEQLAVELVGARGGRVVKTIGDEVMLVIPEAPAACEVALELCEHADCDALLPPLRGAIAYGDVIPSYGDYYGVPVNLAARAVKLARPGTVLVTGPVRDLLAWGDSELGVRPAGEHLLRGFESTTQLFTIERVTP